MPIACSALGCTNRFIKGSEIRFYRFPISKPQLAEQWVRSLGRKNFVPTTNSCLCSEHFQPDCFRDYNGKQFLREDAVPTIFSNWPKAGGEGAKGRTINDGYRRRGGPKPPSSERQGMAAKSKVYDSQGLLISCGRDLCDCLDVDCMGCFYPCPECGSRKCGVECRCDRKWLYEQVEVEGGEIIRNKYAG
ncbi:hypothetical protein NFI96_014959 [Prochilodus magdalenae]|nr:hypothetical protein NFI96_014959 [Prochilodus magdalenae]